MKQMTLSNYVVIITGEEQVYCKGDVNKLHWKIYLLI